MIASTGIVRAQSSGDDVRCIDVQLPLDSSVNQSIVLPDSLHGLYRQAVGSVDIGTYKIYT